MKKILISTGGSGGHVIPALTIYDHLKSNFKVILITDKRGIKFIKENRYEFKILDTPRINKNIFYFPLFIIKFLILVIKSLIILKKQNVDFVISTGGYMSSPLCIASILLKVDIFLFEPNYILGRANKFFLKFCKKIICYSNKIKNFPNKNISKIFLSEPILRNEIYKFKSNSSTENKNNELSILVVGGSQGAKFFDDEISKIFFELSKNYKINLIQQVFDIEKKNKLANEYNKLNLKYELFSYDDQIFSRFPNIDFAISRSGATIISELIYFNIPFLAIPFPHAKDNHQYINAKYFYEKEMCKIIKQDEFEVKKTINLLDGLITNRNELALTKENMKKFSYKNTWNNVNQKLVGLINEN